MKTFAGIMAILGFCFLALITIFGAALVIMGIFG